MKQRLTSICEFLEHGLLEREEAARMSLLAALSGEHVLLIGPPGTAKSELARKLHYVFSHAQYFERLLTKFSVPEELFGPLSIKALEQDRYQRLTDHYLPQASIAFIDEIFKANSAILNALLTLLNEREFDNGSERVKTPLVTVVAASNELPNDDSLAALYDRFLLRCDVQPVSAESFEKLLSLTDKQSVVLTDKNCLSLSEVEDIQFQAASVSLGDDALDLIKSLRSFLQSQKLYISDRRWRKIIKLLKVAVYTSGADQITQWDCVLLVNCVWDKPDQKLTIIKWFKKYYQLDNDQVLSRLDQLVATLESKLSDDASKRTQKKDPSGKLLFLRPDGKQTTQHERIGMATRNDEVLYLAPPDQKDRTNNAKGYTLLELEKLFFDESYKQTHIDGKWVDLQNYINNTQNRLVERIEYEALTETYYFSKKHVDSMSSDVQHVIVEIEQIQSKTQSLIQKLSSLVQTHLWISTSLLKTSLTDLMKMDIKLQNHHQRMQKVLADASSLPVKNKKSSSPVQ